MIARACRALPGVLVTMLLAGPLFAAPALAASPDTASDTRGNILDSRRAGPARHGLRPAKSAARHAAKISPATVNRVAFIDDGAGYTEQPGGQASWSQSGVASWYGGARWQGNLTSSGARYDENALTAAHATLPLGTQVRVALHNSSKFVVVTITDRPGTRTRIIDLSRGAAAALGMLNQGVAMVTLSPI
jgi:rare lipoprotein A (peptidoglycan hydrolase)